MAYSLLVVLTVAFCFVCPAFASHDFNQTAAGTYSYSSSGNWSAGSTPNGDGSDVNFTTSISTAITVTNLNTAITVNYLRLNTGGTGSLTFMTSGNLDSTFGLELKATDFLILAGNTSTISHGNDSFDNTGGTLIVSNGAGVFVNTGAAVQNRGTIQVTAAGGQVSIFNYGLSGQFTNNSGKTVVSQGGSATGTNKFSGNVNATGNGGNNFAFINNGTILANSSVLILDPRNAFTLGFSNSASGTMVISNAAVLGIGRTTGAWGGGDQAVTMGEIRMFGGTLTAYDTGGASYDTQNVSRVIKNTGTIDGSGTIAISIAQSSSGSTVASNGSLFIFGTYAGNQQTFTTGGPGATDFGIFKAVSGGTLVITGNVANTMGGKWIVDNGGTLEIGENDTVDLSAAFMQGSDFNGTIKLDKTANLTLSSGSANAMLNNNGTIEFNSRLAAGAEKLFGATGTGQAAFTNGSGGRILTTGSGSGSATFQTGFGAGNQNYGFINSGTILAANGTLIFNTSDAHAVGFSNTLSGSIYITNGAILRIDRTIGGWTDATSAASVNMGLMVISNGTFVSVVSGTGNQGVSFRNAGTILVQGDVNVTNYWLATLQNAGTILITNNNAALQLGNGTGVNWFTNTATGYINLGTNGAVGSLIATNGANGTQFSNLGTIQGQGTLTLGVNTATNGQNANYQNSGMLIATNWGGASAGTLFISTGNAFSNGGFSNTSVGTILIASNMTLTINRSQNAWSGSGNSIANLGTISLVGGTLNLASDGIVSNAASFINSGTISGWGTIDSVVITTNGGKVFANATNLLNGVGTLTLRVASTTNNSTSTLGTIGTNSVLNLIIPGGQNVLINQGTISVSGGTINFGGVAGTITNFFVVAGVGNLSSFGIVNTGATASIIAQNPIPGLSNLVASVGVTNSAILGANNSGGAATLTLGTSTGGGLVNNGTVLNQGGFITVTNSAGTDAGITNLNGLIVGFGTNLAAVANLAGGTIMASNGVLRLGLLNNANAGFLSNFNSSSTILLTNTILRNTGTIALNGGGFRMGGSVVTNQGSITGPGDFAPALYNDTAGVVLATNGTLNISTNTPLAGESIQNFGTFSIANGSTLNVVPAWLNTNGTVVIGNAGGGGNLIGGTVTNQGLIVGNGLITNATAVVNLSGGTIKASNGVLRIESSAFATNSGTLVGGTAAGSYLQITNLSTPFLNNGTMVLDSPASGNTNLAFYILHDFTNTSSAVIRGAGILRTGDGVVGGGGRNSSVVNLGTIQATNGTLIVDTGDAFFSAFKNNAGATVNVAAASTFGISATTNAWLNTTLPVNNGVIVLSGGTIRSFTNVNTGTAATPVAIASSSAIYGIISNSATGVISGFGTIGNNLINNLGTINATNGTLVIAGTAPLTNNVVGVISIQNGATLTSLQSSGSLQNNGTILMNGGTLVATSMTAFVIGQTGSITGYGTINTGTTSGSGGDNARIVNSGGTIVATNGTLFVNPGDAFSQGGFSNSANGVITIASGAALVLNRTSHAWNNDSAATNVANLGTIALQGGSWSNFADGTSSPDRFVKNVGTITGHGTFSGSVTNFGTIAATNGTLAITGSGKFSQTGTLAVDTSGTLLLSNATASSLINFTNGGSILMRGGTLTAGVIANTNVIFGFGTISGGGVDNSGQLLASNGVLTTAISSFTNGTTATIGTLTTNATLDVTVPGGAGQPLINQGTVSLRGGTMLFNGSSGGTISNRTTGTILGVGNVTQTVVNNGTIMAANPVSGLNIFSVGLSEINGATATLGASNNAVLNVVISGGAGSSFNNNGSITMLGGQLIISNGTPGVITNNAFVSGSGSITPEFVNNSNIVATVNGGVLQVSLYGGTNNVLGNLRAGQGATLVLSNSGVVNLGRIGADGINGGTIAMVSSSGVITNRGTGVISGDSSTGGTGLSIDAFVHNEAGGLIVATNGVLRFNNINGLYNTDATIRVSETGTFQSNSSNSWANAGSIDMRGGTLRTGGYTNAAVTAIFTNSGSGVISGYGTILGGGAYGLSGAGIDKSIVNLGTIIATNPLSGTPQTLFISTASATGVDGIRNLGTMIVSSNNTLSLSRDPGLPILNTGTITIQNGTLTGSGVLSNTLGGIIQGYGTLTHQIVNLTGGTIRATNGILTMTSTIFPVNQGTFEIDNGATMTWNTSNSWANAGTVDMRGGTLRTGGWTNAATIAVFTNLNTITGFGTIYGGGSYNTNGIGIDKSIVNLGTVIANGGTLILDTGVATTNRGLANLNTMIIATTNDTLVLSRTAEFGLTFTNLNYLQNSGTIIINGGTLISRTSITNQNEGVGLPGLIQGFGHIALTNELVNLGTIRSTNTVAGGDGILHFVNPAGSALQIKQSGTLVVEGASEMIFGANTNAPLANNGTILMRGGILRSGMLTNAFGATFGGFGTITSSIINSGTGLATSLSAPLYLTGATVFNQTNGVLGANNGQLIVNTVFTNAGTVSFINSVGVFSNAVVNQGAWIMDPSTNVFYGNYTVASNGYVTMTSGDVSIFKSNFVNQSRNSNSFNTASGKFIFDSAGGSTQVFTVAGLNLGGYASSLQASNETFFTTVDGRFSTNSFRFGSTDPIFGFSNNFALGTLQIGSLNTTSTLMLVDAFPPGSSTYSNDNFVAGLYVQDLTLNAGSLLIISNNVQLYFMRTNGVTGISLGVLTPGANVLILDGGSFHQLAVVPEPSILMLLTLGGIAIVRHRRRSAARARQK